MRYMNRQGWACNFLLISAALIAGCGGASNPSPPPNADIAGQYSIIATSVKNAGDRPIYTDLTKLSDTLFNGDGYTLVCDPNCVGGGEAGKLSATVRGQDVSMIVGILDLTISLTGTVNSTSMSGTYTDSTGDAGNWNATKAGPLTGTYSGTGTADSMSTIPLSFSMTLVQQPDFSLKGGANVTNSPCFKAITFTYGRAIGGAFFVSDGAVSGINISATPAGNNTYPFTFYIVSSSVGGVPEPGLCPGYAGSGTLTKIN
jgi:hypothetical protein